MSAVEQVRELYERYPCPSLTVGDDLILDLALGIGMVVRDKTLAGKRVLDAGCGTGHQLLGLASQYPRARFTGMDLSQSSLDVAAELRARNGLDNVELVRGAIGGPGFEGPYDLIVMTGVLHCLDDPRAGLAWLAERLAPGGLMYLWLFHSFGEHQRLVDRELVRLLARGDTGEEGLSVVRRLGLGRSAGRYGTHAPAGGDPRDQDVLDADAYLHPIVRAHRFGEAARLFEGLGGIGWVALNGVNWDGGGRILDLGRRHPSSPVFLSDADLFDDEDLAARYAALPVAERAAVVELRLAPTGFTIVAGAPRAEELCEPRISGNVLLRN
ncbi:hypothetical protein GCM10010517_45350 [Streptosporangium fragile]|uniref:Methyltransferase type 12 domain-containing protein n=1 Tax=Streptosporangium fragile TaxID=46186 RepID=A0ABP6IJP8_9ACTN